MQRPNLPFWINSAPRTIQRPISMWKHRGQEVPPMHLEHLELINLNLIGWRHDVG